MVPYSRPPTSSDTLATSAQYWTSTSRAPTARPRTNASSLWGVSSQRIVCAISESRGVSPTVGLAFVNLSTGEVVLSQLCDSQTYVRTVHKLSVFEPSQLLVMSTALRPKSKLCAIVEESLPGTDIIGLDRKYWAETTGIDYIEQLAFAEDIEPIKVSLGGNYFATCCVAAVLKYIELALCTSFAFHSLRITFQPPEGSVMIDLSTIRSLELIQNLQNPKSKDCLFGLLNETLTPMGARVLRGNILQPVTDPAVLNKRYDALEELTVKEDMFFATRQALKAFLDVDKLLTSLISIPTKQSLQNTEHAINDVILLKHFVGAANAVFEALTGARSFLLVSIRELCNPTKVATAQLLISENINADVTYQSQPLDLRNQRTYAVRSGVNGLLDVARKTYDESCQEVYSLIGHLNEEYEMALDLKYDNLRQFYVRFSLADLDDRELSPVFINVFRRKKYIECQTLDIVKQNQRIADSHQEVVILSDKVIQQLTSDLRAEAAVLFRISDAIATLDMLASFGQHVTTTDYARPEFTDTLAIKAGRHPIREKIQRDRFIPNDVYATQQSRFQIVTGCNMSGKSTYIRMIALLAIMAQIGCFVPAQYASFPIIRQLFTRVSTDDSIEANVSTFSAEMRETAFILRNIDSASMIIIDELGRGTSTRDGLAIATSIAEALVQSRALVWFATHFTDLAKIMAERNGVVNLHLAVAMTEARTMAMLYKVSDGCVREQHYGLALAGVLDLPPAVLDMASQVSDKLSRQIERRRRTSRASATSRRRNLIISLKESLVQARDGTMQGSNLTLWLRKLQAEFVARMADIDEDVRAASASRSAIEEDVIVASQVYSGEDVDETLQDEQQVTDSTDVDMDSETGRGLIETDLHVEDGSSHIGADFQQSSIATLPGIGDQTSAAVAVNDVQHESIFSFGSSDSAENSQYHDASDQTHPGDDNNQDLDVVKQTSDHEVEDDDAEAQTAHEDSDSHASADEITTYAQEATTRDGTSAGSVTLPRSSSTVNSLCTRPTEVITISSGSSSSSGGGDSHSEEDDQNKGQGGARESALSSGSSDRSLSPSELLEAGDDDDDVDQQGVPYCDVNQQGLL